jgi:hypothetical protein
MLPTNKRLFALLTCAALAGCTEPDPPSPLAEIAHAPLQPGVGVGQLKLKQTTLGAFTRQYGLAQSVVTTEPDGTKVDFLKEGMAFVFRGDPVCAQRLTERIMADPEQRNLNEFVLQNPSCETMLLETIAAYIPQTGDPLYEGETVEGIGLNATRELAERSYRATQDAVNAIESGMPLSETPPVSPNELHHPGIRLYLGKDANGREVVRKLEIIPAN